MKTNKSKTCTSAGFKAIPFFGIVRQYAFLHDLPFFLYSDQLKVIGFYNESIRKAAYK